MPQEWVAFLREFGLPLSMLVVLAVGFQKRVFVLGKDADARVDDVKASASVALGLAEQEKAYREDRRLEERANRLLTEEALRNQVNVMRDMTELLKDIERNFRGRSDA